MGCFAGPAGSAAPDDALQENYRRVATLGLEAALPLFADDSLRTLLLSQEPKDALRTARAAARGLNLRSAGPDSSDLVLVLEGDPRKGGTGAQPREVTLVDLDSDGTLDRIVEYRVRDRRAPQPDQQIIYGVTQNVWSADRVACLLFEQRARDRGFLHLDRWQYLQRTCQWQSDFSGDGFFAAASFDPATRTWHPFDENPFCFFDRDGDGLTDEVLRFSGAGLEMHSIRWSFDVDLDATRISPYDYDLSINAEGKPMVAAADVESLAVRGGTLPVLAFERARPFAGAAPWREALLCVDENDQNWDPQDAEHHERWEGVIAEPFAGVGPVGGPACGFGNKRYEVDRDGSGGLRLYESPIDGKIHLFGAEQGSFEIDDDGDMRRETWIRTQDADGDGYFDTWAFDRDGDGTFEWERTFEADAAPLLEVDGGSPAPALRERETARLRAPLPGQGGAAPDRPRTQREQFEAEVAAWRSEIPPLRLP